ncbi:MAG: hypothetical protein LR015_04215 [Verrucomicrobia bacterium]|nr:hypothetical protein [Verrucomicrobiota bacterium]
MMLRALFNSLTPRERLLITLFVWALALLWFGSVMERLRSGSADLRTTKVSLQSQAETLALADRAEMLLQQARSGLDSARTYSAAQLVGQLDSLAREAGLTFDLSSPQTQETDIFSFHNVRMGIRRAQLKDLVAFDEKIRSHAPYIALSRFQFIANTRDPRFLDATLEISSFELKESALQ